VEAIDVDIHHLGVFEGLAFLDTINQLEVFMLHVCAEGSHGGAKQYVGEEEFEAEINFAEH